MAPELTEDFAWHSYDEKMLVVKYWWAKQAGKCVMCGKEMIPYGITRLKPNAASVEHLIPRRDGGPNTLGNVRLACRKCNNDAGGNWERSRQRSFPKDHFRKIRPAFTLPEKEAWPWHDLLRAYNKSKGCRMDDRP